MRVELPAPLKTGQKFIFKASWNYRIPDKLTRYGRGGFEHFAEDDNNLYSITQWYPRLAVYSDFQGWQHLQFTGGAEFALTFGNFKVNITVPEDHIVAATGECKNYSAVLTPAQLDRWQKAQQSAEPIEVVTLNEAIENSKDKSTKKENLDIRSAQCERFRIQYFPPIGVGCDECRCRRQESDVYELLWQRSISYIQEIFYQSSLSYHKNLF